MKTHQILTLTVFIVTTMFFVSCGNNASDEKVPNFEIDEKELLESIRGDGEPMGGNSDGNNANQEKMDVPAGMLTAGEWSDLDGWDFWNALMQREMYNDYQEYWSFYPQHRYSVSIKDKNNLPLNNCTVELKDHSGNVVWASKTDNKGSAQLWANLFKQEQVDKADFSIFVSYEGQTHKIKKIISHSEGVNEYTIENQTATASANAADVFFVVDATGSMGDEIKFLKAEVKDVAHSVKNNNEGLSLQLGALFYRDVDDDYVTRTAALSENLEETFNFMYAQNADGGGDYPEAVSTALSEAILQQPWRENATTRILFVVLDAPPHYSKKELEKLHTIGQTASEKGIKIIPIAASGIDKDTEFLMRFYALATNGTYTFLTDHSGVGESHLEPTVGPYDIEQLNDLLIRVINENLQQPLIQ
ncbi:MAG: VWA domain-containing protein [Aureispira sp.]|nr:VWA domain-containing protein [Aureispira sp.]